MDSLGAQQVNVVLLPQEGTHVAFLVLKCKLHGGPHSASFLSPHGAPCLFVAQAILKFSPPKARSTLLASLVPSSDRHLLLLLVWRPPPPFRSSPGPASDWLPHSVSFSSSLISSHRDSSD